jgi:hypothetical protein
MKIAFHSNQLGLRGTEVSLYNYALYNEEVLGNESVIITFENTNLEAKEKFSKRFETLVEPWNKYEEVLKSKHVDYLYMIKAGWNDGLYLTSIPTLIHCVFRGHQKHGHKIAFVSDYLAEVEGYNPHLFSIPNLINDLPKASFSLRETLKIPNKNIVLGYHGGETQFNINYAKKAIERILCIREDMEFVFLNVKPWISHPRVHFLPGTFDIDYKAAFIEACDGMIHARADGETFGMSIAEFAVKNKPVITQGIAPDWAHIQMLGDTGIYYHSEKQLYCILKDFEKVVEEKRKEVGSFSKNYLKYADPSYVMEKFKFVYLQ